MILDKKEYIAKMKFGVKTDTGDCFGKTIKEDSTFENRKKEKLKKEILKKVFNEFLGEITQIPPKYSALKHNGQNLYEIARNNDLSETEINEILKSKQRQVEIYEIEILDIDETAGEVGFRVLCSKGTYIRTLCEDIAERLGEIATMKELKRIKVGSFDISQAISINKIKEMDEEKKEEIKSKILGTEKVFKSIKATYIEERRIPYYLNGTRITNKVEDGIYRVYQVPDGEKSNYTNAKYIGIGLVENNLMKREYVENENI